MSIQGKPPQPLRRTKRGLLVIPVTQSAIQRWSQVLQGELAIEVVEANGVAEFDEPGDDTNAGDGEQVGDGEDTVCDEDME
eukprot:2354691-Lingulodinium_polyedra.AAC.1